MPKNNHNWARPSTYRGQEKLGQCLAQTIVEGTGIDSGAGMNHTESVVTETFSGSIAPFASDKEETVKMVWEHIDTG